LTPRQGPAFPGGTGRKKNDGARARLSILVVEDDPLARRVLRERLDGHRVEFAADAKAARARIAAGDHDICFIDLKLGPADRCSGLALIPLASNRGAYTVVMSGHDSERHVERAYDLGCDDFYAKGGTEDNVGAVLARCLGKREAAANERVFEERFLTRDAETRAQVAAALRYAATELPVLILGPSGTGKTSLARVLHEQSGRAGEFVAINCSAVGEELLEAELFGWRKGAFTSADESRKGKLLLADQETLFLDEIGSMSLKMQAKLLKAVEERSFYPLGAERPETSRFRLISATLEDLQGLIQSGRLRFDFYQRIHGVTVRLKPLARRRGDLLPLIRALTRGRRRLSFTPEAKRLLLAHDWPGNVRELKKLVELLAAGEQGRIGPETLAKLLKTLELESGEAFVTEAQYREVLRRELKGAVESFVDEIVLRSLEENGGKKTKVLAALKIATRLLYASLKRQAGRTNGGAGA